MGSGFCSIQVFAKLATASNNATAALALRQSFPKQELIGLCRDLRGIASAISGRRQYSKSASLILSLLVWSQHGLSFDSIWMILIQTVDMNHRKNQQNEMALHHLVAILSESENIEIVLVNLLCCLLALMPRSSGAQFCYLAANYSIYTTNIPKIDQVPYQQ